MVVAILGQDFKVFVIRIFPTLVSLYPPWITKRSTAVRVNDETCSFSSFPSWAILWSSADCPVTLCCSLAVSIQSTWDRSAHYSRPLLRKVRLAQGSPQSPWESPLLYQLESSSCRRWRSQSYPPETVRSVQDLDSALKVHEALRGDTLRKGDGRDHLRDGHYQWWGPLYKKRSTTISPKGSWQLLWVIEDEYEMTSWGIPAVILFRGVQSWKPPMHYEWTNVFTTDCCARLNVAFPPKYQYTVCAMRVRAILMNRVSCGTVLFYFAPLWVKQCCNWRNLWMFYWLRLIFLKKFSWQWKLEGVQS